MRWRIKRDTNDELRQKFVDITVPQADALGLKVPDPALQVERGAGRLRFRRVDWEEFYAVVRGEGPVAKERMKARRKAWETGPGCAKPRGARREARGEKGRGRAMRQGTGRSGRCSSAPRAGCRTRHVGSVHAPDAEMALRHARDTYTRRMEGVSLWVVPSASIAASDPGETRRCSIRPRTRSTATRPSTTFRTT